MDPEIEKMINELAEEDINNDNNFIDPFLEIAEEVSFINRSLLDFNHD